jgi:hypothetical protein
LENKGPNDFGFIWVVLDFSISFTHLPAIVLFTAMFLVNILTGSLDFFPMFNIIFTKKVENYHFLTFSPALMGYRFVKSPQ